MIYFIDEEFVKQYTSVQDNVDMKNIEHNLVAIFDLNIKHILGSYFSIYLLDKYQIYYPTKNPTTFTSSEKELIKLIQKTMAWRFCYEATYDLSWQLSNKGAVSGTSDFYVPVQDPVIKFKADRALEKAAEYQMIMEKYVCDNVKDFPNFTNELNKDKHLYCDCGCGGNDDSIYVAFG